MSFKERQGELRQVIDEMMWGITINAQIAQNFISLGDDAGLEYAVRQTVARAKVIRDVMIMMKKAKHQEDERNEQLRSADTPKLRATG